MNCELVQRRLLGEEDPGRPAADLQAHLDGCTGCRDWHGRLLHLEESIPLLPVPPSSPRADFWKKLASVTATPAPARRDTQLDLGTVFDEPRPEPEAAPEPEPVLLNHRVVIRPPHLAGRRLDPRQRWYVAAGVAASLLLCSLLSVLSVREQQRAPSRPPASPPDPLVAQLMRHNMRLAEADTPRERAVVLERLAGDLRAETQLLARADGAEELFRDFTGLYTQVAAALIKTGVPAAPEPEIDPASAKVADARRVQQMQRNRLVIHALVEGGLRLVWVDEPLKRVDCFKDAAQRLAGELRQAAADRESDRAVEMGQHLHDLLHGPVARNVSSARRAIPAGSAHEVELRDVGDWVVEITRPLEEQLKQFTAADHDDVRLVYQSVLLGRQDVERALRG